jgi:ribosomal protein L11 methylase PrmA
MGKVGDEANAEEVLQRLRAGERLVYRGDFRNARQLHDAIQRRLQKPKRNPPRGLAEAFHAERARTSEAATLLSRLLVVLDGGYALELSHAPVVAEACTEAFGPPAPEGTLVSLRELLGAIGAHEWRRKGVKVAALGASVHPHYGVFAPVRQEYVELVAAAPLPPGKTAYDVGTGTGVLALVLAKRGAAKVIATDVDPRAVACARENVERLGYPGLVTVLDRHLFPEGRAEVVVMNPPWMPGKPRTRLDRAVYDPDSATLLALLAELPSHLAPGGEGWLVMSDLPERLGLRPEGWLAERIAEAGLVVASTAEATPSHPRASDEADPLHPARAGEITRLWILRAKP